MIERHVLDDRAMAAPLLTALAAWDGLGGCGWQLHPGDIGWFMRFEDDQLRDSLFWWDFDGEIAAAALYDGSLRTAVDPRYALDVDLAEAMAELALRRDISAVDAQPGACALRPVLAGFGYEPDLDSQWLHLFRSLRPGVVVDADVRTVTDEAVAEDRVAAHRAAFAPSTYTLDRWRLLAGGPAYRPELDLVVYADGAPAAVATAWSAGEGRCGLIEPVGTDPAFRGRGLGGAAVRAACSRLSAAGASGVAVWTPARNAAGAALYRGCGFVVVAVHSALRRRGVA